METDTAAGGAGIEGKDGAAGTDDISASSD